MTSFNERERAEEHAFAHAEELRFLAAREGTAAVAAWAAERLGKEGYEATLVDALVAGGVAAVAARVRDDLAGAGRPEAAAQATAVLERAVADARLRRRSGAPAADVATAPAYHPRGFQDR